MTLQALNDAKHWRDRAAEMRVLSREMKDFEARTLMLKLANDYDKLADRASDIFGALGEIRTPDPQIRSPVLDPDTAGQSLPANSQEARTFPHLMRVCPALS